MKFFEVEYIKDAKRHKIILKANDKNEVKNIAKNRKYGMIVKIGEGKAEPIGKQFSNAKERISSIIIKNKIKTPLLVATIKQLAVMSSAGISIHESIKEVARSSDDANTIKIFNAINDDLNQGLSLSQSMQRFRTEFGDVTLSMVRLGEETGNMGASLTKLAHILQDVWDNQQKFKKAIRYPLIVIATIVIAFTIMITQIVPKFKAVFEQLGAQLPLPTKLLLAVENFLNNYGVILTIALCVVAYIFRKFYLQNRNFKARIDEILLKSYLVGKIIFFSSMSRFSLIFTELVRAGVPIISALDTALLTISNEHLRSRLSGVNILVKRGVSLTESFKDTGLYESMLLQMIHAGEQSGNLDTMLENVTNYYKMKFNDIIDNISSYIEPILLALLAVMVTILALGIFMPMWDMAQAVKM